MYFNRPAGKRRSGTERCLCKKWNEQCYEREKEERIGTI
jgi:hypothetical protein